MDFLMNGLYVSSDRNQLLLGCHGAASVSVILLNESSSRLAHRSLKHFPALLAMVPMTPHSLLFGSWYFVPMQRSFYYQQNRINWLDSSDLSLRLGFRY